MFKKCAVIVVTHNSESYLDHCIYSLRSQTVKPQQIIVFDSGSKDLRYLDAHLESSDVTIIKSKENVGFSQANNMAFKSVSEEIEYLLFLNPDAFLTPTYLQDAIAFMEQDENAHCGAMTGVVLGYDVEKQQPTGLYDSSGIFQRWWGRWYDRGQGGKYRSTRFQTVEPVPAICGALFFARRRALQAVALDGHAIFDPDFFMYKEDIDLSCRLRRAGWQLFLVPHLTAYHCRGWQRNRAANSRPLRLMAAKNELTLHKRYGSSLAVLYSLLKLSAVKFFNV